MIVPITAVGLGQVGLRFLICVCIIKCLFWIRSFEVPREIEKKFEIPGFRNKWESVKFVTMNHFLIKTFVITKQNLEHYFTMPNDQNIDSKVHT